MSATTRRPVPVYRGFTQQRVGRAIGGLAPNTIGAYELDCQPAAYTVTGTDATIIATRVIDAQPATYAVTGSDATLARGLFVNAETGSLAVAVLGFEALLARDLTLNAATTSYTLTGVDVTFDVAVDAQPATYAITGSDATLDFGGTVGTPRNTAIIVKAHTPKPRAQESQVLGGIEVSTGAFTLDCQPGAYTLTGVDATLEYQVAPAAAPAVAIRVKAHSPKSVVQESQVIGGLAGLVVHDYTLDAQPGSFAVTGVADTGLEWSGSAERKVVIPVYAHSPQQIIYASRVFYGVEIVNVTDYSLHAEPGSYTVTGTDATLPRGLFVNAASTSYAISGVATTLARGYFVNAVSASYTVTGTAASFLKTSVLNAVPGSLTVTGVDASFLYTSPTDYEFTADPGSYNITGTLAILTSPQDMWVDHIEGDITFTDHLVGAVISFDPVVDDSVLFTDHTPD